MLLNGKSGCNFEILNKNFDFYLRKFSKNVTGNERLIIQANKQIDFFINDKYSSVKTPEIIYVNGGSDTELAFIDMQYIFGKNAISFLQESDIKTVHFFVDSILSYLDNIFKNVKIGKTDEVYKKVDQVNKLTFPNKDEIIKILIKVPSSDLMTGQCHGDFTMANMVFTNSTIYALDFLNTYINSPILDLLSIRQDTHHLWSCLLTKTYNCRTVETLKYVDDIIKKKYNSIIQSDWYRYLSLMNYTRMYPFNTGKDETEFINNCILEYL